MTNHIGELSEIEFFRAAMRRNLKVVKPLLHDSKYDCIIDNGKQLLKIQIKSTSVTKKDKKSPMFGISVGHGNSQKKQYSKKDVDYFALYLIPYDTWFIIPVGFLKGKVKITLNPHSNDSKYTKFKEAWHQLVQ